MKRQNREQRHPSSPALPPMGGRETITARWAHPGIWGAWAAWVGLVVFAYFRAGHTPVFSLEFWIGITPPLWDLEGSALFGHLLRLFKLAAFAAACAGVGRALLTRVFRMAALDPWESAAFSYGLGTGVLGLAMILLALAHLLKTPVVLALSVAMLVAAVWLNLDLFRPQTTGGPVVSGVELLEPENWPVAFIAGMALAISGFYALSPELFYDSLVYHLATPSLWNLSGGAVATPENMYSGIPMHAEMLYGWALLVDDEILAKLIHWSMGAAIAASFLGLARRSGRPGAGWTAAALFLGAPLVGLSLFKTAVECVSTLSVLLSFHALALWLDAPEGSPQRRGAFLLSAVMAGLAMATKYTNWPLLGVLAVCLLVLRMPLRAVAGYCALALAPVAPWVFKNLWFYGNPIFPYFQPGVDWRALQIDAWGRNWPDLLSRGPVEVLKVLAHPWFMTLKGASDADYLGPLFLAGLPALLLFRPVDRTPRLALWILAGLWLLWWPVTAMPRFFMPGLALFSLWLGWTLEGLPAGAGRRTAKAALAALSVNNLFWVALSAYQIDSWNVVLRGADKGAYLNRAHPTYPMPYFAAADWINRNAPAQAKVLVVGDGRGYYLQRRFLTASALDAEILPGWLKASPDAAALKAKFEAAGVTHLLVNIGELLRLKRDPGLGEREIGLLEVFLQAYARQRFSDVNQDPRDYRWQLVYEIGEPEGPGDQGSALVGWYREVLKNRR